MNQEYVTVIKEKKEDMGNLLLLALQPHPHRLNKARVVFTSDYAFDGRVAETSPYLNQQVSHDQHTIDAGDLLSLQRLWPSKLPVVNWDAAADGQIQVRHTMRRVWEFDYTSYGTSPQVVVGTVHRDWYTWNGSAWVFDFDEDIDVEATLFVGLSGGGFPESGGYDNTTDAEVTYFLNAFWATTPPAVFDVDDSAFRSPWTEPWAPVIVSVADFSGEGPEHSGGARLEIHFDLVPEDIGEQIIPLI